jgi:hypothetical protein
MPNPARSGDVEVRYASGDAFMVEPLSPAGEAWLDGTAHNRPTGAVRFAMRHLDNVLSRIRQAGLQVRLPWDLKSSQLVADCRQRAIDCAEKAETAISNTDREFLLDMTGRWLFLAKIYEFTDGLGSLSNDRHQDEREQQRLAAF